MRSLKQVLPVFVLVVSALFLAGCKSVEERAEGHFQNAVALIEKGDVDRAMVELRNVFELNGQHVDARRTMAKLLLDNGNERAAYGQYATLSELDPNDAETRIILSQMAFNFGSWDELDRHGAKAEELLPEDPRVKAIALTRAYRTAVNKNDQSTRRELGRQADALLVELPDSLLLRNVIMDNSIREQDFQRALQEIDWMLAEDAPRPRYYQERLRVLALLGDADALEEQLRELVTVFPDEQEHKVTLLRYLMSRDDLDGAESFLRELADAAPPEDVVPRIDLIRFLAETRSIAAAREELEKAKSESPNPIPFTIVEAGFDFTEGEREKAIASLQDALEKSSAADEEKMSDQTKDIKIVLANMLLRTGNEVGARAHVEELLADTPTHPAALKMQATWLIDADDTDGAISALRLVLDQKPNDTAAMTLMSSAYARAGQKDLAKDFLAQAARASGNAPAESIRYARVLIEEEKYLPAEDVLLPALRIDPTNTDILLMLGQIYLRLEDFGRAGSVIDTLRRIGGDVANQIANGLEAEQLNRQKGTDEAVAFLEKLAGGNDASLSTRISLIRARLGTGDVEGAVDAAKELKAENPDNPIMDVVLAVALTSAKDYDAAEAIYRGLLDKEPRMAAVWLRLSQLMVAKGARDDAKATVEEGLTHAPDNADLLWAKASFAESDGDIDTAIDIYETLYELDSSSVVVANNLASLLSTYRTDEESLNRAWTIARRLSGFEVPALQDTYGWILHLRGNSTDALPILESAAEGLPSEPLVQYHLGKVYMAEDRPEDALKQLRKAVDLAGPTDTRPQIEEARSLIQSLQNPEPSEN